MATNKCNIQKHELEALAMCFLPNIQAFFETVGAGRTEERGGLTAERGYRTAQ
jgi:hypothetical protein